MYEIKKYTAEYETVWDDFVMHEACNGTFLQTKRFLNYHPEGRFVDASLMVFDDKKHLAAVCPACEKHENGKKTFYSHGGSTYGGIVIAEKHYKAGKVIEIIRSLEEVWRAAGYTDVVLKQTPSLLAGKSVDLFQYCFYYLGYQCCNELNLYVNLEAYAEDILPEFASRKRRNIVSCQKQELYCKSLTTYEEIAQLYQLLEITLQKYDKKPVHTVEEIYEFQTKRLLGECECFGIFCGSEMLAASMMFYFEQTKVAHTQYLCANPEYNRISPMSFLYYSMLVEMKKKGYKKVSWGIVTEESGTFLNEGLVKSKEEFGSRHGINPIFLKTF